MGFRTRPAATTRRYSRSRKVCGLVNLAAIVALLVSHPNVVMAIVGTVVGVVGAAVFVLMLIGGGSR